MNLASAGLKPWRTRIAIGLIVCGSPLAIAAEVASTQNQTVPKIQIRPRVVSVDAEMNGDSARKLPSFKVAAKSAKRSVSVKEAPKPKEANPQKTKPQKTKPTTTPTATPPATTPAGIVKSPPAIFMEPAEPNVDPAGGSISQPTSKTPSIADSTATIPIEEPVGVPQIAHGDVPTKTIANSPASATAPPTAKNAPPEIARTPQQRKPRNSANSQIKPVSSTSISNEISAARAVRHVVESPKPQIASTSELPFVSPEALAAIRLPQEIQVRARNLIKEGTSLAKRGALHSARQEFLAVMQLVSQALDAQLGVRYHTKALSNGLRALEEADDFVQLGNEVDIDLHAFVAGHKTPVLKTHESDYITPFVAMQRYYQYAQEQLAISGHHDASASAALYAMGRVETMFAKGNHSQTTGPKPLALYQAAVVVDRRNTPAANELGVLLARAGKYPEAQNVLARAATARPSNAVVNNLAQVQRLMRTGQTAPRRRPVSPRQITPQMVAKRVPVQWVSPGQFSNRTGPTPVAQAPRSPAQRLWAAATPKRTTPSQTPPQTRAFAPRPGYIGQTNIAGRQVQPAQQRVVR